MGIQIENEQHDNVRILALNGRLDTETAVDVELAFEDLLQAGDRNFLIDLAGIGYVSSAGLRVLLALAKKLDGGKGSLRLCSLTPAVRQVFEVAGFSKLFAISADRAAALGSPPRAKRAKPAANPLAEQVSSALGIQAGGVSASSRAVELAQVAALLLGIKGVPAGAVSGSLRSAGAASARVSSSPVVPSPPPGANDAAGIVGKLKRMFGGKD